jgi:hypothetical protein
MMKFTVKKWIMAIAMALVVGTMGYIASVEQGWFTKSPQEKIESFEVDYVKTVVVPDDSYNIDYYLRICNEGIHVDLTEEEFNYLRDLVLIMNKKSPEDGYMLDPGETVKIPVLVGYESAL